MEVLHESIINSITSGLIVLDHKERVILFNPTAEEVLGIRSHNITGLSMDSALPALQSHFQRVSKMSSSFNNPPFVDVPHQKRDGTKIYLRLSISPLHYLSHNKGGTIIVLQDVTEIKRIEENMKKVEGLALVGEMAAGIATRNQKPHGFHQRLY